MLWQQKRLNVEVDMEETEFVSNKDLCRLVWRNLISNAVKYTPDGGEISIRLYAEEKYINYVITNTCASLRGKENLVFQPFRTSLLPSKRRLYLTFFAKTSQNR